MPAVAVGRARYVVGQDRDFSRIVVLGVERMYVEPTEQGRKIALLHRRQRLILEKEDEMSF